MQAVKGSSMEKGLCWGSLVISGLLLLLFLLDVSPLHIPFGGLSTAIDVICILASAILIYLSWDALRDWL